MACKFIRFLVRESLSYWSREGTREDNNNTEEYNRVPTLRVGPLIKAASSIDGGLPAHPTRIKTR